MVETWVKQDPLTGRSFTVCGCRVEVKKDAEGKEHFEATCASKANRDKLAALFEEEAILRVNPKVILDDTPPVEPPAAPAAPAALAGDIRDRS